MQGDARSAEVVDEAAEISVHGDGYDGKFVEETDDRRSAILRNLLATQGESSNDEGEVDDGDGCEEDGEEHDEEVEGAGT